MCGRLPKRTLLGLRWGVCFSGHLPKPFLDHFLVIFGTAGGQILALISLTLEHDLVAFLSFLDTAGGQILYVNPRFWRLFRTLRLRL